MDIACRCEVDDCHSALKLYRIAEGDQRGKWMVTFTRPSGAEGGDVILTPDDVRAFAYQLLDGLEVNRGL